jgi:hypothetical protein
MRTRHIFKFILPIIIYPNLILCGQDNKYQDEFYSALNYLLKSEYKHAQLISNKTVPVFRNAYGNCQVPKGDAEIPPPPPPPGIVYYDNWTYTYWEISKRLESNEIEYLYRSIDSTKTLIIDSLRIKKKIIPSEKLFEIVHKFKNNLSQAYQTINDLYGSSNFIEVSTPIYTSNFNKTVISIVTHSEQKQSKIDTYILGKTNRSWTVIKGIQTVTRKRNSP